MATDYGGPINKAAYVTGTLAVTNSQYDLMAAVMAVSYTHLDVYKRQARAGLT